MATNPAGGDPIFTQEVLTGNATISVAKSDRNSVTNAVLLLTAGAYGALVKRLRASPAGAVSAATKVMAFRVRPAVSTTVAHLVDSVLMAAYATDASTTATPVTAFSYDATTPLRLGPGEQLWVACAAANGTIEVDAEYENF